MTTRELDHPDQVPPDGADDLLPGDVGVEPVAPGTASDAWWPRGPGAWARFTVPPVAAFLLEQVVLSTVVPCVALCTRLPKPVLVVLLGTSVWLALGLAPLFTASSLI